MLVTVACHLERVSSFFQHSAVHRPHNTVVIYRAVASLYGLPRRSGLLELQLPWPSYYGIVRIVWSSTGNPDPGFMSCVRLSHGALH